MVRFHLLTQSPIVMSLSASSFVAHDQEPKAVLAADAGVETGAHSITLRPVSPEMWDEVMAGFDGACQEQLYVFAKHRWPGLTYEPVLFCLKGEIVGGVLLMIQPLPLKLGAIAVAKWAPMFVDNSRADFAAIYAGAIEALIAEYDVKRRMMISVLPRAAAGPVNKPFDYLLARGFRRGSTLMFPNRYLVDLRITDEDQRRSLKQKWRYHLNKSMKSDLTFEYADASQIDAFNDLYNTMTDRKRFADHSAYEDTINALMAMESDGLRPEIFFVREAGEIIAGAVIFKAGDTAVYLYGATNARALSVRAGYFIHWQIIRWLRDNTDAKWYDLGGTDGFEGLHRFKKGMVGDAGVISPVPPVANYASHTVPFVAGMAAFFARDVISHIKRFIELRRPGMARPDQER